MPTYEFQCQSCRHEFSILQSMAEREQGKRGCPQCGSEQVEQKLSVFTAKTSRKS